MTYKKKTSLASCSRIKKQK